MKSLKNRFSTKFKKEKKNNSMSIEVPCKLGVQDKDSYLKEREEPNSAKAGSRLASLRTINKEYVKESVNDNFSEKVFRSNSLNTPAVKRSEDSCQSLLSVKRSESAFSLVSQPDIKDRVKVLLRIRPQNLKEIQDNLGTCIEKVSDDTLVFNNSSKSKTYTFDFIASPEVSQEDLFMVSGAPVVDQCLSGYNGCIFAYGQTGSGKTYTMLGEIPQTSQTFPQNAGVIPRVFKYIFDTISQRKMNISSVEYKCSCSFLEIYNESITDLLDPSKINLHIRDDKNGTYVTGLTEKNVNSVQEAMEIIIKGMSNRKIAHTNMNSESSRSHSVLTCIIKSKSQDNNGQSQTLTSRLNLVDLAGSERQSSTGCQGDRLKEASKINQSLSALGLVIKSLTESKSKKQKHIPYRDSKLTFLLQDCLGGNSKTVMIANISPATKNMSETLSTLTFAKGAKQIKNKIHMNKDCNADFITMQKELNRLKAELMSYKKQEKRQSVLDSAFSDFSSLDTLPYTPFTPHSEDTTISPELDKVLAAALYREETAYRTIQALTDEMKFLQEAIKKKDSEIRKAKLIVKFREDKILRLEEMIRNRLGNLSWIEASEVNSLRSEVQFFKEKADRVLDATKYAIENMQLKNELLTLHKNLATASDRLKHNSDVSELKNKLLEMNQELERIKQYNLDEVHKKAEEIALHMFHEHSKKIEKFMINQQYRHIETIQQSSVNHTTEHYLCKIARWAKKILKNIVKPLSNLRSKVCKIYKKTNC